MGGAGGWCGRWTVGLSAPQYTWDSAAAILIEKSKLPPHLGRKLFPFPVGYLSSHSPSLQSCCLHPDLFFLLLCSLFRFCFVMFFFPFFSPILHLSPCWENSNICRLRGVSQAVGNCNTIYSPRKVKEIASRFPADPKTWTLQALPNSLQGAPPYWV